MGTNRQVEIFEVGKEQLWKWCGHMGRTSDYSCLDAAIGRDRINVVKGASLAKGRYVLVSARVWFDGVVYGYLVLDSFRSRRKAEDACARAEKWDDYFAVHYSENCHSREFYEVWHIVDDAELWGTWQALVDAEREEREALAQMREAGEYCEGYEGVKFSSIREASDYVRSVLGERAGDYDVEAVARDMAYYYTPETIFLAFSRGCDDEYFQYCCECNRLGVLA